MTSNSKASADQSAAYRVGIIGCGRPWRTEEATGMGMAHRHAMGYAATGYTQLVALSDISRENALAFQETHGGDMIFEDYRQMLTETDLDIVSVCVWPHLHAEMVIAAAEAGVKAVHCEKPMAPTFGEAKRMAEVCESNGVQLTFNHQRRFAPPICAARDMVQEGAIGTLQRVECYCPNMNDWGTHWFDIMHFCNDESPAEWVLGQIDTSEVEDVYGVPHENQGISQVHFQNGVEGLLITAQDIFNAPFGIRLQGSEGIIDLPMRPDQGLLLFNPQTSGWEHRKEAGSIHDFEAVSKGVIDLIDALRDQREPEMSARRALRNAELTFATYESSRKRGRVDLPLEIDDSPLIEMLASAAS